uniref:Uncharacterized protein n=1 Tax=Meloidogyne incognita TaxID=6306 RepID=A0A914MB15_MELIC
MHRIQQNKPTTIIDNISLKSNQTTQSNQQLNNSSSPSIPKRRTSGSTGGIQKRRKKENILNVPEPPPRHSSGDLVAIKEKEINKNAQLLLHSFGRPLNSEELNNKILEEEEEQNNNNNYCQEKVFNNNIQIKNKKQKNNNCDSSTNIVGTSTSSDYLTMKPVHRAKPFKLVNEIEKESLPPPPPPPQHRTTTKLYDCPIETNIDSDENEEIEER